MQEIKTENGTRTPEVIAKECNKYGKFIGMTKDPFVNAYRKYYDMSYFDVKDKIVEITISDDVVISARYVPAVVARTLPPMPNNIPDFGNF